MSPEFICKWLREFGPVSEPDSEALEFIFIHDPELKYDVRRVVYDTSRDLWIYADNAEPATLADTMASLRARGGNQP